MAVVFIHGVNTREGQEYQRNAAARDELIRRLLLKPLGERDPRFRGMEILSPYWGADGVSHRWNQATVPHLPWLQALGAEDGTPESDLELQALVRQGGRDTPSAVGALTPMGATDTLKSAAQSDLPRFMEAVLAPLIRSELDAFGPDEYPAAEAGMYEALLLVAARDVAHDPEALAEAHTAPSDAVLLERLKERVQARFERLLLERAPAEKPELDLESLGPIRLEALKDRAGELFNRVVGAPGRLAGVTTLQFVRDDLHTTLTRFMGDVFVYLIRRGSLAAPGPIVKTVLHALRKANQDHPNEPLLMITHSMGGNILYDILTYYAPDVKVDVWVSAGGQVGQFEEMKIFVRSNAAVGFPQKVTGLSERVGLWFNVYDPADILSFLAEPVFAEASDVQFNSGADVTNAHGAYFKRPSFYDLLRERIEGALR